MFTQRIVIQERVEDLQLRVESYQKKINLKKPDTYSLDLRRMTPYTAYPDIQGIIYEDEMNKNRLMRTDELHKFSEGALNHVRTALNDIATEIEMDYLPKQKWKRFDTSAGNSVKEILPKLNLPDHSDDVLKLKNFKKDALLKLFKLTNQESLKSAFKVFRHSKGSPCLGLNFKLGKCLDLSLYVNSDWCYFEVMWILKILKEMKVDVQVHVPLHCDNNAAIHIAANLVFHEKTKHFELDLYFLREKIQEGFIKTEKVKSAENTTDVFTKGLSVKEHKFFCDKLGLLDLYKN
nr:hypothetical protein [Tanacetum cinerariifolium]GEY00818.1 hypothetical protein [Tanacetum cinerariifolium]GEY05679.1 hypothetical protein [Tanacetum cinerariifolium]